MALIEQKPKSSLGSKLLVIAVFAGAVMVQAVLVNMPRPVDLADKPAAARAGDYLTLGDLGTSSWQLTHSGRQWELVDAYFDRAKLAPATLKILKRFGFDPPTVAVAIDCPAQSADNAHYSVVVRGSPAGDRSAIVVRQTPDESDDPFPAVELKAEGAVVEVDLFTSAESGPGGELAQNERLLRVGDWEMKVPGSLPIKVALESGSWMRFAFRPASPSKPLWKDGRFRPFSISGGGITAGMVRVSSPGDDRKPSPYEAKATEGDKVKVGAIELGPDFVEAAVGGRAWLKRDGKTESVDLLGSIKNYPLMGGLVGMIDAAILAWAAKVLFSKE